jgi:glutaminyl-tRNA synthetase
VDENLDLLARMRAGEFEDGIRTLRGKIDMAAPNLTLRDPVFYRIQKITHQRTGDAWSIYPMYDFAHCISDSIEKITHSLCSIEFDNNRPLYDWILDTLELDPHPQQIEFARLNLTYTVTGKRKLRQLVEEGHVRGWDDPRMPTIRGLARRGYTARSLRTFAARIGVTRNASTSELALLEHCVREDLNAHSPRVMAVLDPLRLVIENYPEDQVEQFEAVNNPEDASAGTRQVPFSRELWIERDDFREEAPRKFFRLSPGREVRLRAAYLVTCTEVVKNDAGDVIEVRCRYDPETRGGDAPDGRKVKGTLHWVSASHALSAEVRLYETLFSDPAPDTADDFRECLNPDSLKLLPRVFVEPSLAGAAVGERYQFERLGYFCVDPDTKDGHLVFNRTVPLRDSWARLQKRGAQ